MLLCLQSYLRGEGMRVFGHSPYCHVLVFRLVPAHVSLDPPLSYLLQKPVEASADLEIND